MVIVTVAGLNKILSVNSQTGAITASYGNGVAAFVDGGSASFNYPISSIAIGERVYVADMNNHRIRVIDTRTTFVSTLAGDGTLAVLSSPAVLAYFDDSSILVCEYMNPRITLVKLMSGALTYIAGTGISSFSDGFGLFASFNLPLGLAVQENGAVFLADRGNNRIRQLTCVPCPASFYCYSGAPVLCPAGSSCPLSSINATLCPRGSFSNAGASNCTLCSAGTFTSAPGSTVCQQCPSGHYCPTGTSSWARLNCGRGNYCPSGSGAPTPCPHQVPPSGGWGALQAQGPAFLVETASCLNHCFWNFTSGDGLLSTC